MVQGKKFIALGLIVLTIGFAAMLSAGCGSSGTNSSSSSSTNSTQSSLPANEQPQSSAEKRDERGKATLEEIQGSGASGIALLGAGSLGDTRLIQFRAQGLEPTGVNAYAGWLAGPSGRLRSLATFQVGKDGKLKAHLEVAEEAFAQIEAGTYDEVLVTQGPLERLGTALEATTEGASTSAYTGKPVMRGRITGPITGS